jgi:SH3-like domain-containing protein
MKGIARTVLVTLALCGLVAALGSAPAAAQQLCVKAARANLRAGPGTDYRITWEVNRYMPFIQVGAEGDWLKVRDVDGDLHWVYSALVTDKMDCVTISAAKANIRKKPSSRSEKWFTVEKYTSFKKTGEGDNWVKLEYEGETMYVYNTLVWPG